MQEDLLGSSETPGTAAETADETTAEPAAETAVEPELRRAPTHNNG